MFRIQHKTPIQNYKYKYRILKDNNIGKYTKNQQNRKRGNNYGAKNVLRLLRNVGESFTLTLL